jgi:hypothetical protein
VKLAHHSPIGTAEGLCILRLNSEDRFAIKKNKTCFMRISITKYGLPQVVIYPILCAVVMVIAAFAVPANGIILCF